MSYMYKICMRKVINVGVHKRANTPIYAQNDCDAMINLIESYTQKYKLTRLDIKDYLVHRIDGEHNEHVHDVMRVEAAVHCTGEPFLGDVHGANHAASQGYCVLK